MLFLRKGFVHRLDSLLILIELKIVVKNVILLVVPFSWEIILVNSLPLDGMKQVQRCSLTKRESKWKIKLVK